MVSFLSTLQAKFFPHTVLRAPEPRHEFVREACVLYVWFPLNLCPDTALFPSIYVSADVAHSGLSILVWILAFDWFCLWGASPICGSSSRGALWWLEGFRVMWALLLSQILDSLYIYHEYKTHLLLHHCLQHHCFPITRLLLWWSL